MEKEQILKVWGGSSSKTDCGTKQLNAPITPQRHFDIFRNHEGERTPCGAAAFGFLFFVFHHRRSVSAPRIRSSEFHCCSSTDSYTRGSFQPRQHLHLNDSAVIFRKVREGSSFRAADAEETQRVGPKVGGSNPESWAVLWASEQLHRLSGWRQAASVQVGGLLEAIWLRAWQQKPCWSNRWPSASWELCPQISIMVLNSSGAAVEVKKAGSHTGLLDRGCFFPSDLRSVNNIFTLFSTCCDLYFAGQVVQKHLIGFWFFKIEIKKDLDLLLSICF